MMIDAIKQIVENSDKIITWSLSIIGGSILVIFGSNYIWPKNKWMKFTYLLFIPGWSLLACGVKLGTDVANRTVMYLFDSGRETLQQQILNKINNDYADQLNYFNWGMLVFGLWLCIYLFWWIFFYEPKTT